MNLKQNKTKNFNDSVSDRWYPTPVSFAQDSTGCGPWTDDYRKDGNKMRDPSKERKDSRRSCFPEGESRRSRQRFYTVFETRFSILSCSKRRGFRDRPGRGSGVTLRGMGTKDSKKKSCGVDCDFERESYSNGVNPFNTGVYWRESRRPENSGGFPR